MNAASLVAFNLLVNAIAAFAVSWLLVRVAIKVFRPAPGFVHVALSALPFVRLVVDLVRGIPAESFLWLRSQGVPQDLGSFQVGFGLWYLVPRVHLTLGALSHGALYSQSGADLLAAALTKKVASWTPGTIACGLLAVGVVRLARRAASWRQTALERRALSEAVATFRDGRRRVVVFVADAEHASPFTGGILSPYVVFPRVTWEALTAEERLAAIEHELAHVAEHHLLVTTAVGIVSDLFWFVPFGRRAAAAVHQACELSADARAVGRGVSPALLASALVRVREAAAPRRWTLAASGDSVRVRLARLLEAPASPRFGFQHRILRLALTAWVGAIVVASVFLGNH